MIPIIGAFSLIFEAIFAVAFVIVSITALWMSEYALVAKLLITLVILTASMAVVDRVCVWLDKPWRHR